MIEMLHCYWLSKNKYKLDKLNLTRLWALVIIYQMNTRPFILVTIYPKIKRKTKHKSTYPKELNSKARLWNEKVLSTHSAQTKSSLLDSNDQYTIYAWYEWYIAYITNTWLTLTQINLSYECILFFLKISNLFFMNKKIDLIQKKKRKKNKVFA